MNINLDLDLLVYGVLLGALGALGGLAHWLASTATAPLTTEQLLKSFG